MFTDRARPLARIAALFLFLLLPLATWGCGDSDRPLEFSRKSVPIADVPGPVMKVAKSALRDTDLTEAWKNVDRDGKLHSYEIRGKTSNGKVREARVTPEGKVLETE